MRKFFRKPKGFVTSTEILKDRRDINCVAPKNIASTLWKPIGIWPANKSYPWKITTVDQAYLADDGVLFNVSNVVPESVIFSVFEERFRKKLVPFGLLQNPSYVQGAEKIVDCCLVFDHWSKENYFHWVIDSLQRIEVALSNSRKIKIILPENCPTFITESLRAYEDVEVLWLKKGTFIKCCQTSIIGYPNCSGITDKETISLVRNRILNVAINNKNKFTAQNLYISRNRQSIRRVANEVVLIEAITKKGFQLIYFEDYSFWEQVAMMQNAETVITSHGANLVNILFMKESSKVIEINAEKMEEAVLCYWVMANQLGLDYYYLGAKVDDKGDYEVNIDAVLALL